LAWIQCSDSANFNFYDALRASKRVSPFALAGLNAILLAL
jgi:hypothetical protein